MREPGGPGTKIFFFGSLGKRELGFFAKVDRADPFLRRLSFCETFRTFWLSFDRSILDSRSRYVLAL